MKKKFADIGFVHVYENGAVLATRIERELPKLRALAARAGIVAD